MRDRHHVIVGCGDIGRRVATQLIESGVATRSITALVQSQASVDQCAMIGVTAKRNDLDTENIRVDVMDKANVYYLVPPQKSGTVDVRSRNLIARLISQTIKPNKIVLVSTTGVYGDCTGQWVDEQSPTVPQTDRGKRRLDSENQWRVWARQDSVALVILRVPGIYAFSRLPRARIAKRTPVVRAEECGFSNRIHADDLATILIAAMHNEVSDEIYNASDGKPGKISDYLQATARVLGEPSLPEISMREAEGELSEGMLSYLSESRKISNEKMLMQLKVTLRYPNYLDGIKFG